MRHITPTEFKACASRFSINISLLTELIRGVTINHEATLLRCKIKVVNASGSVGSNYIEANESLSKKDFLMRIKICRKEAKESRYWLRLIDTYDDSELEKERSKLVQRAPS